VNDENRVHPTTDSAYADRLVALQHSSWKRLLPVQVPYRWNLRRLKLGHVLDIGCGIGRNLGNLSGNAVGIDHNPASVSIARSQGFEAFAADEFLDSTRAHPQAFDSLLFAHILEHMSASEAVELVRTYLPYLRRAGAVVVITPQERGFRSDPTHVEFLDFAALSGIAAACSLTVLRNYSFPFPRFMGRTFPYNEFVLVAEAP
jgi:2-polyprenyl-3-methyl-5-hydroxy-6-metoxy-1,4-benzoquinol methylase